MTVNSKLNVHEKALRKQMRDEFDRLGGMIYSFPGYSATVAIMEEFPGSRMMLVSVSIAEPRESKFRRKVGEFHALRRMFEAEYIKLLSVFNTGVTDTWDDESTRMYQDEWAECFAAGFTL